MIKPRITIRAKDDYFIINQYVKLSRLETVVEFIKNIFLLTLKQFTFGYWKKTLNKLEKRSTETFNARERLYHARVDETFIKTHQVMRGKLFNTPQAVKKFKELFEKKAIPKFRRKPQKGDKNIGHLPDSVLIKILQDGLQRDDKVHALKVCQRWHVQGKKLAQQEILALKPYVETLVKSVVHLEPIAKEIQAILDSKEIHTAIFTSEDRLRFIQKEVCAIFNKNKEQLNDNAVICKAAFSYNGWMLQYASDALKNDPEVVKIAVTHDGEALLYASAELKNNAEIVRIAVAQNGNALQHASAELKKHVEIVKIAVAQDGKALKYARPALRDNDEIARLAIEQDPEAIKWASARLRNNFDLAKIIVAQNGVLLTSVSANLADNPEIVKIAISQNHWAFQYASARLRGDIELVKLAVNKCGYLLMYVSPELKNNAEIVKIALSEHYRAFEHASTDLQKDPEMIALFNKQKKLSEERVLRLRERGYY